MKYLYILLISCSINLVHAQSLFKSIEKVDISSILEASDAEIDLCILDSQNIYTKEEAREQLVTFFNEHKPATCEAVHSGSSRQSSSSYRLGKLTTTANEVFRVFIYTNENDKVIELRIDKW